MCALSTEAIIARGRQPMDQYDQEVAETAARTDNGN